MLSHRNLILVAALLLSMGAMACSAASRLNTISAFALRQPPALASYLDPEANLSNIHTFSVFPLSIISPEKATNEIMEKQILFFLRSQTVGHYYPTVAVWAYDSKTFKNI